MSFLSVKLPRDRDRCGTLSLYDARGRRICGPFAVAGRASDALAKANGNARRNPLLRFGDTPTGAYRLRQILDSGKGTRFDAARFGAHGIVVLEGVSGDAALAEANGRFHFLVVGGKRARDGALRSTAGSLRLADEHQKALTGALRKLHDVTCEIEDDPSIKARQRVFVDPDCQDHDPLELHIKRGAASRSIHRELLLSGAAGAMMSVAFVALPPAPARASEAPAPQSLQNVRDEVKFLPPTSSPDRGYVRLAYDSPSAHSSAAPSGQGGGTALEQLKGVDQGGAQYNQPVMDTPGKAPSNSGDVVSAPAVAPSTSAPASTGNSQIDQVIQQQRQINAIQAEKPPPSATQDQLNQWQQDKQQRIQAVTAPPAQTPAPPKSNSVVLDKGAPPPPPKPSDSSSQ